jgi:hypothetical protein
MISTTENNPVKRLDTGNSLETSMKNPIIYKTGNFRTRISASFLLGFWSVAILKIPTSDNKFAIDHDAPTRSPIAHGVLWNNVRDVDAATINMADNLTDLMIDPSTYFFSSARNAILITLAVSLTLPANPSAMNINDA